MYSNTTKMIKLCLPIHEILANKCKIPSFNTRNYAYKSQFYSCISCTKFGFALYLRYYDAQRAMDSTTEKNSSSTTRMSCQNKFLKCSVLAPSKGSWNDCKHVKIMSFQARLLRVRKWEIICMNWDMTRLRNGTFLLSWATGPTELFPDLYMIL